MAKFLLLFILSVSSLCAQLDIYSNIEKTQKKIKNDPLFQISLDIVKKIQKKIGEKNSLKVHPFNYYKQGNKNSIFIGSNDQYTEQSFKPLQTVTTEKYNLYGNKYEIYYIYTLEDAKSAKKIYCKKCEITKDIFEANNFQNISYVKYQKTGLKNLLQSKERLWLISNWKVKQYAKEDYKKLKPVHTIKQKSNYIMLPNDIDEQTFQKYTDAFEKINRDGTLEEIVTKWGKKLNLNLELKSNGTIAVIE